MPYPTRLLSPAEQVVLDLRGHWRALARPLLLVPLTVGVAAFVAEVVPSWEVHGVAIQGWLRLVVLLVALFVLARWSLRPYLVWQSRQYVVTTQRIVLREGVLARRGRDVPLERVHDVSFAHTAAERLFRSGTLVVESAGEHGQVVLVDVPRVESVQRTVSELVRRASSEGERTAG